MFLRTMSQRLTFLTTVFLSIAVGCSTGPREIETPQGPRSADQTGPFIVVGVISRNTSTLRRANANPAFEETITINVPPGTQFIIPAVRGWAAGYGKTVPEDLSQVPDPNASSMWHPNDEHFGLAWFNVFVDRINAVDNSTTPPTQTAVIKVTAILGDQNLDNEWWGLVNYNLLCFAPHP